MAAENDDKKKVEVSPAAFCSMILHAAQNPTAVVHGILVGSFQDKSAIFVHRAIPVSHETPSKPMLDTALALACAASSPDKVVGWYTAPERLGDTKPGPVALRIAASMATADEEPVLVVLNNQALADCIKDKSTNEKVLHGLGKDFGQQWLEPLDLTVKDQMKAQKAASSAFQGGIKVFDMMDHFEDPCRSWIENQELSSHLTKVST
jgi:hypothetical protein